MSDTLITHLGMLLAALIASSSQIIVAKNVFKQELAKIKLTAEKDLEFRLKHEDITNLRLMIAELITLTNPDNYDNDWFLVSKLSNQIYLVLNDSIHVQKELIENIEQLILFIDSRKYPIENVEDEILHLHSQIIKNSRLIVREM